jgi:hypothetical protein
MEVGRTGGVKERGKKKKKKILESGERVSELFERRDERVFLFYKY